MNRVLPRGTAQVGAGLGVLGVASYVYLSLAARQLSPQRFGEISVLYSLVYTAGAGAFLPVEQELARGLADRTARSHGGKPLVRLAGVVSGAYAAVVVVLLTATGPLTVPRLFDGSWALLGCLIVAVIGLWSVYLGRGVLAGANLFAVYGGQLALEGGLRIVAVVGLAAAGVTAVAAYGLAIGVPLLVAAGGVVSATRPALRSGPPADLPELSTALGWLLAGSVLAQALVNAPPIAAKLLARSGDSVAAGQVLTGTVLTRLPLFAFAAVQAALLPGMAAMLATGDRDGFVQGLQRLLAAAAAVTVGTALVVAWQGQHLLHLFFGNRFDLANATLVRLAVASGVFMAGAVVAQSLLALRRYRAATTGWAVGVIAFLLFVLLAHGLVRQVVDGFVVGTAAAAAAMGLALVRDLRRST